MSRNAKISLVLFIFLAGLTYLAFGSILAAILGGTIGVAISFSDIQPGGGSTSFNSDQNVVNPANGLPMIGGTSGVDVQGNHYGTNNTHW